MSQTISDEQIFDIISAPFWKRLLAWITDQAVLGGVVALTFYLAVGAPHTYTRVVSTFYEEIVQISILANLTYFTALEGAFNQTLGKRLLGILVYEGDGAEVSFTAALFRRIGLVIPLFAIVDGGTILVTSKNQRIFDILAGTVVVKGDHESDAVKFLGGEDIADRLRKKGILVEAPKPGEERDQKALENLKEMKAKLEERFKSGELGKDQYSRLKEKYESRISSLEEKLGKRKKG